MVLIDACHAAGMATTKVAGLLAASRFVSAAPPESLLKSWQQSQSPSSAKQTPSGHALGEGRAVISSSRADQSSYYHELWDLSIFTYHLREVLSGKAKGLNVKITTLISYLDEAVRASALRVGKEQTPWTDYSGEDFWITQKDSTVSTTSTPLKAIPVSPPPTPVQPAQKLNFLHLSDVHLGTAEQAQVYYSQLETDLLNGLDCRRLDYLILNGDMADKAASSEYESALWLVERIMSRFKLSRSSTIIVPGNHDVSYVQSKQAYSRFIFDPIPPEDSIKRFIPQQTGRIICEDDTSYEARFSPFAEFYQKVCSRAYPLNCVEQAALQTYPKHKLLFLGLNSAHEVDHFYQHRASIYAPALAKGLDKVTSKYKDWLKIAIWHHPICGSETMNTEFMQQLTMRGFQICMHGHIHEAMEDYHKFDDKLGIRVIGAGTFGAPAQQQSPGIPLQYNLITLNPNDCTVQVESRKREKLGGVWTADSRWVDKIRDPQPRYSFNVKWELCAARQGGKE